MAVTKGSPYGYHYYNEYQSCPRKWFLHHYCGLEPTHQKPALLLGSAWHETLEEFLRSDSVVLALNKGLVYLDDNIRFLDDKSKLDEMKECIRMGLPIWLSATKEAYNSAWHSFHPTALELTYEFRATDTQRFPLTARLDGLVEEQATKQIYLLEHKSTSYSASSVLNALNCEDQITCYMGIYDAVNQPSKVVGALVDIINFKPKTPTVTYDIIIRSEEELAQYSHTLLGLQEDISQKLDALRNGLNQWYLFPRNGAWCGMFGCPYEDVCRLTMTPDKIKEVQDNALV